MTEAFTPPVLDYQECNLLWQSALSRQSLSIPPSLFLLPLSLSGFADGGEGGGALPVVCVRERERERARESEWEWERERGRESGTPDAVGQSGGFVLRPCCRPPRDNLLCGLWDIRAGKQEPGCGWRGPTDGGKRWGGGAGGGVVLCTGLAVNSSPGEVRGCDGSRWPLEELGEYRCAHAEKSPPPPPMLAALSELVRGEHSWERWVWVLVR